jgi:hypothetical protein
MVDCSVVGYGVFITFFFKFVSPLFKQYKYTYDMPKDEAIKQAVKTRKEIIDHNLLPPLDEDPESDYEYENVEDNN